MPLPRAWQHGSRVPVVFWLQRYSFRYLDWNNPRFASALDQVQKALGLIIRTTAVGLIPMRVVRAGHVLERPTSETALVLLDCGVRPTTSSVPCLLVIQ